MARDIDEFRVDSHKLIYHPERVSQWLNGEIIYPLFCEVGPASACNSRCYFCAFDYVGGGREGAESSNVCW